MIPNTDQFLLTRIAARDTQALGLLYDIYGAHIYALAFRITGSQMSATLIVQEVFAECWKCPSRFVTRNVAVPLLALTWKWAHHMARSPDTFPGGASAPADPLPVTLA